jgi:hypothetical protein
VNRRLLVTHKYKLKIPGKTLDHRIEDINNGPAGIPKNGINTLGFKSHEEHLRSGIFHFFVNYPHKL